MADSLSLYTLVTSLVAASGPSAVLSAIGECAAAQADEIDRTTQLRRDPVVESLVQFQESCDRAAKVAERHDLAADRRLYLLDDQKESLRRAVIVHGYPKVLAAVRASAEQLRQPLSVMNVALAAARTLQAHAN